MFEKSLYDLIRGLRNHKGNEVEYIQNNIRECKDEIRSQDMDIKTTALLKLIYLEMFGYDMSWASFHVLEVMSSAKYLQKRVGYLGAVQSFRSDTEVLMLATNLLKKDIVSSVIPNLSLPLAALPHIATPSLSMALLSDILPRLSHSNPAVRKKTVVTLYRLALVYPEALRVAWPHMKERLMDHKEDSSVTAALINVICELGWRRPYDFLPLAPRLFELLVDGGNNWMAIKIIKLFATLTPLEPRLIKKLLRPLTNLIQTTTAMSLLYECINGIVQGGLLDSSESYEEGLDIAILCVAKLRAMILMDSDPNLRYVALLAFNRIAASHPSLVAEQQDVIFECLDDADISIRLQALQLVKEMISVENLATVIERLIAQLTAFSQGSDNYFSTTSQKVEQADDLKVLQHESLDQAEQNHTVRAVLPYEYLKEVIHAIIDICSRDTYAHIPDFDWYIETLMHLARVIPSLGTEPIEILLDGVTSIPPQSRADIPTRIGTEFRNVAVRVKASRIEAVRAAEFFIHAVSNPAVPSNFTNVSGGLLGPAAWLAGEYAADLASIGHTLECLIDPISTSLPAGALSIYVHAVPKVFVQMFSQFQDWSALRLQQCLSVVGRITIFLESLVTHPDLDVQERSVEFLELFRIMKDALPSTASQIPEIPALLSSVMPSLFMGLELKPIAASAQKRVPFPPNLDLNEAFNGGYSPDSNVPVEGENNTKEFQDVQDFYRIPESSTRIRHDLTQRPENTFSSPDSILTDGMLPRSGRVSPRRIVKSTIVRDDPYYIESYDTHLYQQADSKDALVLSNDDDLDIDSIPIINLSIGDLSNRRNVHTLEVPKKRRSKQKKVEIVADEGFAGNLETVDPHVGGHSDDPGSSRRSFLTVDSSSLENFALRTDADQRSTAQPEVAGSEDDAEMLRAMQEVERLRLQLQRSSERINAPGIPADGQVIKKKRKKKKAENAS